MTRPCFNPKEAPGIQRARLTEQVRSQTSASDRNGRHKAVGRVMRGEFIWQPVKIDICMLWSFVPREGLICTKRNVTRPITGRVACAAGQGTHCIA